MKRKGKPQGSPKNKLIITWKDYSSKPYGTEKESFRCTSEAAANKILSKRDKRRIYFAVWYNNIGKPTTFNINTKDTILAI